jgi:hypothetical protein
LVILVIELVWVLVRRRRRRREWRDLKEKLHARKGTAARTSEEGGGKGVVDVYP